MIRIERDHRIALSELEERGQGDLKRIAELVGIGKLDSEAFNRELYGNKSVKRAFAKIQHNKCCYCERKLETKHATVEHFRPKTKAKRKGGQVDVGYWWLAYEPRNLYFACPNCNTPKGDYFPIEDGTNPLKEGRMPWDEEAEEHPLLVDPGFDEPEKYLLFEYKGRGLARFCIIPRGNSVRGRETIDALRLNREDLLRLRKEHVRETLKPVLSRFENARRDGNAAAQKQAQQDAGRLSSPKMMYSSLACAFFKHHGVL